jgi:hypothetical protein
MKKIMIFYLELLISWRLATGKEKRTPRTLTSGQQLNLQAGTCLVLEVKVLAQPNKVNLGVRKVLK